MGASLAVKEAAEAHAGRERLAMEAFARALENIPSTRWPKTLSTDSTRC